MDIKVIIGTIGFGWIGWLYGVSRAKQYFMEDPVTIASTILGLVIGYYISSS